MNEVKEQIYTENENSYLIINPHAGVGKGVKFANSGGAQRVYVTKCPGDATDFAMRKCLENPRSHFTVYGGDGSINEVVNGIMRGGGAGYASISAVPFGTGNDFVRWFDKTGEDEITVDVIKSNDNYSINMINIGFDCDVVTKTDQMKNFPFFSGNSAYVAGVAVTVFNKMGKNFEIELVLEDGRKRLISRELLLTAIANAPYCGGGFYSAPKADPCDGLMDVVAIKKMSRLKFASLISYYKNGTYLNDDLTPIDKVAGLIDYMRCRSMTVYAPRTLCIDGIVITEDKPIEISVIPKAIRVVKNSSILNKVD